MGHAFVVDAIRTPRGRGKTGGALSSVRPVDLLADLLRALVARSGAEHVDDVVIGCAIPTGEQGSDVARMAAICAGLGRAGGTTVSRFCASGLDAIAIAAARVSGPMESAILAGGVEMLSRVPMFADEGPWFADDDVADRTGFVHMAVAADLLATIARVDKDALDAYAARSHQRAAWARDEDRFASVVPVTRSGVELLAEDELIRDDLTLADLAARPPSFGDLAGPEARRRIARRHAGISVRPAHQSRSAPQLADGASALLITDEARATQLGGARARVLGWAGASVDPTLMLTGNVEATRLVLDRCGLELGDIDVFEVNESFAVVPLHFARTLDVEEHRLNPNGGAIAMGHPLGATGGMLVATALDELERTGGKRALVSICGGAGVATALVLERV